MSHTPGPWSIRYLSGIDMEIVSDNGKICSFSGFSHSVELMDEHENEEKANARLVSAAPLLLEALESIRGIEAWITDPKMKKLFQNKVYPAINKAKGL